MIRSAGNGIRYIKGRPVAAILMAGILLFILTGGTPFSSEIAGGNYTDYGVAETVQGSVETGGAGITESDKAGITEGNEAWFTKDNKAGITEGGELKNREATWLSILPPLAAIAIALVFRQVLIALFIGIWLGAWLAGGLTVSGFFSAFFHSVSDYIVPAMAVPAHVSIIVFSLCVGGMVGIIGANGGTRGVVRSISRYVTSRRRAQLTTTGLGYIIFFDDYANTMVVGSTMRPLADRLRISRAKLAYLVDSTAAPVAIIAIISTWIGAVIGYIHEAESAIADLDQSAYFIFLKALPYNFYAFLAIIFVAIIAFSGRDFGPMRKAEVQALTGRDTTAVDKEGEDDSGRDEQNGGNVSSATTEAGEPAGDRQKVKVSHGYNAVLPVLGLVGVTLAGLWFTGEGTTIQDVIGSADSYAALVWGSVVSLFVAGVLTIGQRLLSVKEMLEGMYKGMHVMFEGLIILVLAWSLGMVTQNLDTAGYLVSMVDDVLNPYWLPVIVFVLSGFTSFATGSSWGTMGIITPLVLPLVWTLGDSAGLGTAETETLVYTGVSAVLAGSVWGDHCSPISDTTILSSLACRCDHVAHVNTQLPYAMVVGGISILALIATVIIGVPVWLMYAVAIFTMAVIVYRFGRRADNEMATSDSE